ncbi:unnamed protein product [Amoebophrya sp. A120]|nr:unnamed protein product [Amoebophrya sp. A120]|eukprot:GSA120T00018359001.1
MPPRKTEAAEEAMNFDFDGMPVIINVKPEDQLELTEKELEEEVEPRVLYPNNPRAPHNITQYSYKERAFKRDDQVDQMVMHLETDATILKKESPEEGMQQEILKRKKEEQEKRDAQEAVDVSIQEYEGEEAKKNTLRNQFNFSERASQTYNEVMRTRTIATQPPLCKSFAESVTQWIIYDSYMKDIEAAEAAKQSAKEKKSANLDMETKKKPSESDPIYSDAMKLSIKLMERMVNQNAEAEIYHDFKFWEDKSDEFRPDGEGTLLPLWRFTSEKVKRKQVTAIRWNPKYTDLFAVGFGSYDFMRQGTGCICCYSLKNTKFPEFIFNTDSGVCSLDWHPSRPALLAVGLYDGTVLVYDVRGKTKRPIYASTIRTNKHSDPVWEVRWNDDPNGAALSFYSVSADGRVSIWLLMKDKLESEELMALKLHSGEEEDTGLTGLAGGLCFDFHKTNEDLFLIGTEEGRIHKCSKSYSGQYLDTYEGHSMAVYAVRWNHFHPNIFISSSADWTVKMWDHTTKTPIMSFDLAQQVGDVAWAPYSSTVFAAITADGVTHVYDLSINRNGPLCWQKVVAKAKCTHLGFNGESPILIVGDDRGGVTSLKLSPNLRKSMTGTGTGEEYVAAKTGQALIDQEIEAMETLLGMVVETTEQ